MKPEQIIETYRPLLFTIAKDILGNMKDAEDVVQETFIKWLRNNPINIENNKAYLVRAVTNASINFKKLVRNKVEIDIPELPDWIPDRGSIDAFKTDMEQELHEAYQALRERLTPSERGVYILKELFGMDYEEISEIFERQSTACRKLFSRAKQALFEKKERFVSSYEEQKEGFFKFMDATENGKLDQLIGFLKKEMEKHT